MVSATFFHYPAGVGHAALQVTDEKSNEDYIINWGGAHCMDGDDLDKEGDVRHSSIRKISLPKISPDKFKSFKNDFYPKYLKDIENKKSEFHILKNNCAHYVSKALACLYDEFDVKKRDISPSLLCSHVTSTFGLKREACCTLQ